MSRPYSIINKVIKDTKNPLKFATLSTQIPRTLQSRISVTAPEVAGYTFLCWIAAVTTGWIGTCYFESPQSKTSSVWVAANPGGATSSSGLVCHAMYIKNELISS